MRLLSYLARCKKFFGVILSPHRKREMKYILRQCWSGCAWKKTSPNLCFWKCRDWKLMLPLELTGVEPRSFAAVGERLPVHSTVLSVLHVLEISRQPIKVQFTWRSQHGWWEKPLPRKSKRDDTSSKPCWISEISGFASLYTDAKFPQVRIVRQKQWFGLARLSPWSPLLSWRRQIQPQVQICRHTSGFLTQKNCDWPREDHRRRLQARVFIEEAAKKQQRFLTGRPVAWMIFEFFKVSDTDETFLECNEIDEKTTCSISTRNGTKPSSRRRNNQTLKFWTCSIIVSFNGQSSRSHRWRCTFKILFRRVHLGLRQTGKMEPSSLIEKSRRTSLLVRDNLSCPLLALLQPRASVRAKGNIRDCVQRTTKDQCSRGRLSHDVTWHQSHNNKHSGRHTASGRKEWICLHISICACHPWLKKNSRNKLTQPTCYALKTSERPLTSGPVVVGIHLRALLTKKKLQAWECVQSSISTQAAGEPKKRNHSVTVTNTLDTTQEEEITSLKFKAKKDLLHVVSAIPMKFSSRQTE